jgi:putative flavoprotein involved in K+ transport
MDISKQNWDTIVVGAGQAGLATAYYLSRLGHDFLILDAGARVGEVWRNRWDSLRLFTPAQYDGLPGLPLSAPRGSMPTKDDVADYLEEYAAKWSLPIALNVRVTAVEKAEHGYTLGGSMGTLTARHIVVATGANQVARVPSFADALDPSIYQLHSSAYHNPGSLPDGDVLIVGAGASGVEIAIENAARRHVLLAGELTFHIPDAIFRYAGGLYWAFAQHVLTIQTPVGRKARGSILKGGGPLIGVSAADLKAAGVERVPRVIGVQNGMPQLQDGRVVSAASVVWATGYQPDFGWIHMDVIGVSGWPVARRGVCANAEGLYFVGLPFQYSLTSGLLGGVGRDAAFVVDHIRAAR